MTYTIKNKKTPHTGACDTVNINPPITSRRGYLHKITIYNLKNLEQNPGDSPGRVPTPQTIRSVKSPTAVLSRSSHPQDVATDTSQEIHDSQVP